MPMVDPGLAAVMMIIRALGGAVAIAFVVALERSNSAF